MWYQLCAGSESLNLVANFCSVSIQNKEKTKTCRYGNVQNECHSGSVWLNKMLAFLWLKSPNAVCGNGPAQDSNWSLAAGNLGGQVKYRMQIKLSVRKLEITSLGASFVSF